MADERVGGPTLGEDKSVDLSGAEVEVGVGAVAHALPRNGAHIHSRPDETRVQINAQALGCRSVERGAILLDDDLLGTGGDCVVGDKAVGLFDHTRDVGHLEHEAHDLRPIRREHRAVELADLLGIARRSVFFEFLVLRGKLVQLHSREITCQHMRGEGALRPGRGRAGPRE